jgi:hypothetical protein
MRHAHTDKYTQATNKSQVYDEKWKLKNLSLSQTTTGTWATSTKRTKWLIAIQLVKKHSSGQTFFHLLDLTTLTGYIILSSCGSKFTTENLVWFWFKICWKWNQGSLIFHPPQEDNQTHRPVASLYLGCYVFSPSQMYYYEILVCKCKVGLYI